MGLAAAAQESAVPSPMTTFLALSAAIVPSGRHTPGYERRTGGQELSLSRCWTRWFDDDRCGNGVARACVRKCHSLRLPHVLV